MDAWCGNAGLATLLPAALVAGLAASGHCAAMCGGVAGALAIRHRAATPGRRALTAVAYNLARISSYGIAGALAGLAGGALLSAIETAEIVDIQDHRRAGLRHRLAGDAGAARRQVGNGAARFAAVGGNEQPSGQVHLDAAKAPAFGARLRDDRLGVLHGHRQALHGPAPIVNASRLFYAL